LESELVSRSRARQPRDAIRLFAEAIAGRDIAGALHVLTQRRRDGLTKQVEGFVAGIGKRIRYRIVLRKEDDEWRVDDIYIRPSPRDDDDGKGSDASLPEE